ncbi:MAG: hypothetical protein Q4F00_09255 [bacterium]|nr:hypothetical protein [bacterium]
MTAPAQEITREGAWQAFMPLRSQAQTNGLTDMSLRDINEEIKSAGT